MKLCRFAILIALLLQCSVSALLASSVNPDTLQLQHVIYGSPSIRYLLSPRAEWDGDSLRVRFSTEVSGRIKSSSSLHLVPIYILGRDTIRYPELGYFSPSGAKFYKRREALSDTKTVGQICVVYRRSRGDVDYQESMLLPQSVTGRLQLQYVKRNCGGARVLASLPVDVPARPVVRDTVYATAAARLPLPMAVVSVPLFETSVTFIEPQAEEVKYRTATATIRITYPVDHWEVYPDFENNGAELQRIAQILPPVTGDTSTYHILSASITGYASPEGTYDHNLKLSQKRAEGMRNYLQERYGMSVDQISAQGLGEDWVGLRDAVEKSDMEAREEVIDIIDMYDIFNGREKTLMDLHGGAPYRYMLENLFPPLRRMEMRIDYRVRPFALDEAGSLIDTRPQDLSLYEMYEVAQAENDDQKIVRQRDAYGREYDVAVHYFPNDDIANINAASAALVRGDMEMAWVCLGRVIDNPLAANNLGVYHWLCGKIEEARMYFEKARATDPVRADYNLEQLKKWEAEFGQNPGNTDSAADHAAE